MLEHNGQFINKTTVSTPVTTLRDENDVSLLTGEIASVEASEDSMVTENSEVTPSQKVAGKYEAAYLADDKETKFWLIQERTNKLVFGWSPFHQDNIDELVLEQNVDWGFDITTSVRRNASSGDMHVIGKACEFEQFSIVGMDVGFIYNSVVDHRSLTYERVTRINSVNISFSPESPPYLTWEKEAKSCSESDLIIIFRGNSNQPLEMHFISDSDKKFYLRNKEGSDEGREGEEVLVTTLHGKYFSLPKLASKTMKSLQ
ncbi:unnamed protein product [Heterobilharzia americana]|nr:unnamed protein product [Heterobilharzia americana]